MESGQISKIRIVIAASNLMAFRLLARTLERSLDLQVVATVGTKDGLFKSLQDTNPDIALISVHLQDGLFSSFAHLQGISHRFPNLPWVLLLAHTTPQLVVDAFRAGARGVFSCSESETKLLGKCVRRVVKGEIWADTAQVGHIVQALTGASSDSESSRSKALSLLTAREETVVRLVANGLSNRDIAQHLGLSEHTIKNGLSRIFEKLGFSNRVELVLYAIAKLNQAEFPSMDVPCASVILNSGASGPGLSPAHVLS
jgi:two-component system nitrate/nitrite response regulator NarL